MKLQTAPDSNFQLATVIRGIRLSGGILDSLILKADNFPGPSKCSSA